MESIRINQAFSLAILVLMIGTVLFSGQKDSHRRPPLSSVSAFHFFPHVKFYLNIQNRISSSSRSSPRNNVVRLACIKVVDTHGVREIRTLPQTGIEPNQDWGFSFRTGDTGVIVQYCCDFFCLYNQGSFMAFQDTASFANGMCGGRHCTWMFNDDGLFLYNLKDQKYHQKISFKNSGVNNGTANIGCWKI